MKRTPVLLFALALITAGSARAASLQCDIEVGSAAGGIIEVISAPSTPDAPRTAAPTILWRPSASGRKTQLIVAYQGSTLEALGEPSGVHILFPIEPRSAANSATLAITSPNGRTWRFVGQALEPGTDDTAYVEFGESLVYGRALLGAIADGQDLTIAVERYDRVGAGTKFGLSNLRARDALLAQAKRKFENADPAMCKMQ